MADTVEIFLRPYIVRWLAVKLNEEQRHHSPNGNVIWRELLRTMEPNIQLVQVQPHDRHLRRSSKLRVALRLGEDGEITVDANRRLASYAEAQYDKEFVCHVDAQYYSGLAATKSLAVESFRRMYNITEDDLPLATSLRRYQRYEQRLGRKGARGGARLNSGPQRGKRPEMQKQRGPYRR